MLIKQKTQAFSPKTFGFSGLAQIFGGSLKKAMGKTMLKQKSNSPEQANFQANLAGSQKICLSVSLIK